jgi:glycosyltransferase involved in cell wall biosynthesis
MHADRDRETKALVEWGIALTEGYAYTILNGFNNVWNLARSWFRLWRELRGKQYDALVVPAYGNLYAWTTFVAGLLTKTPMIASSHSILYPRPWWRKLAKRILLPLMFRRMQAFLPQSTRSAELYAHYGAPINRIFLFPFAVDNDYFIEQSRVYQPLKSELRRSLRIPTDAVVVLFVGKLVDRKRPLDVLRAVESLEFRDQTSVIFVGDGNLRPTLEEYARRQGVSNVVFAGFRNQAELPQFYAVADIFVLPSQEDPWGAVINEAMCFGLPVVTTNAVGASKDLVFHGENGFVYRAGDIQALRAALGTLITHADLRQKMGERSFEIISTWNYELCIKAMLQALAGC